MYTYTLILVHRVILGNNSMAFCYIFKSFMNKENKTVVDHLSITFRESVLRF